MNTMIYALVVVATAVAAVAFALAWWLRGRDNQKLFGRGSRVLTEQLASLQVQLEQARAEATAERDKSSRYFLKITDFEQERDRIHVLYTQHAIGHGNAQQLMMTTIETLARQLQAKGIQVKIPQVLHVVREEYLSQFEMPVRAAEAIEKAKAAAQAAEPPVAETA